MLPNIDCLQEWFDSYLLSVVWLKEGLAQIEGEGGVQMKTRSWVLNGV